MRLYSIGDRVSQAQYGDGTVSSSNEYHTKVEFDVHGPRTFASSRVVLTPSDTPAPIKATTRRKRATKAVLKDAPKDVVTA